MGGVAGHMSHLYENPSLTFREIKDVLQKAAAGELIGTEKTDGQNLFVSYSVKDGRAKAARNKGDIKRGGMTVEDIAAKFAGRGALSQTFTESFAAFEKAINSLSLEEKIDIFGPDANVFYNAEIQDPRSANVINYDTKNLTIHRVGHAEFNKMTGDVEDKDLTQNFEKLESALERAQIALQDDEYNVQVNAIKNLRALSDDVALNEALSRIEKFIDSLGISDNHTIGDMIIAGLDMKLDDYGIP